jgi:hypothetical protein
MTMQTMSKALAHLFFMLVACTCWLPVAQAHKASDSYLTVRATDRHIDGQWDIALRDLDFAIGLDTDGNGELTWDEIRSRHADIAAYAMARLALATHDTPCPLTVSEHLIDEHTDGAYAVMRFTGECAQKIDALDIRYSFLFELDPQHKGLLRLDYDGATNGTTTAIFDPERTSQRFTLAARSQWAQRWARFGDYLKHGIWHIWIGFDHILFLISLLLPAVLAFRGRQWKPAEDFRSAFADVLKIVSAFTVAHSITLTLAAVGIVSLPSRWVESAIAASVVLAALNNVLPFFQGQRWMVAFAFGLIHGFGFASVLIDLGLPKSALALALLGFNLGVEIGQLVIVAAFLPIAHILRETWVYRRLVFTGGSAVIASVATVWFVERAFDMKLFSV